MTTDQPTDAEVKDLATKVETFAKGLSPNKQALFTRVLASGGGLEEVKGYNEFEPFHLPIYDFFASAVIGKTDTSPIHKT